MFLYILKDVIGQKIITNKYIIKFKISSKFIYYKSIFNILLLMYNFTIFL